MKQLILILSLWTIMACNRQSPEIKVLQNRIDSLEQKMSDSYKPGFGEFMSNIQSHHMKLWFAGQNKNWKLADFEIHEIMESVEDIQKYETDREESQLISMIFPALDSVNAAIQQQDSVLFKRNFETLTNTCNECHIATKFDFNVVKIPEYQPFSNQSFSLKN